MDLNDEENESREGKIDFIVRDIIEGDSFHELFCDEALQDKAINFLQMLMTSPLLSVKLTELIELKEMIESVARPVAEKLLED